MKIHNIQQGSLEWLELRKGIPTTSEFSKIITPTGKLSSQAKGYQNLLLAELFVKNEEEGFQGNYYTERGSKLEVEAIKAYELLKDVETTKVGFITNDEGTIGCSPDSLVGDDGLLEIKCPMGSKQVDNFFENKIDSSYIPQVQGQLLVTGRKWVDWFSYHPELPEVVIRIERDEEYIERLSLALDRFNEELAYKRKQIEGVL